MIHPVRFKVTDDEYELIASAAKESGQTIDAFLRNLVLGALRPTK